MTIYKIRRKSDGKFFQRYEYFQGKAVCKDVGRTFVNKGALKNHLHHMPDYGDEFEVVTYELAETASCPVENFD